MHVYFSKTKENEHVQSVKYNVAIYLRNVGLGVVLPSISLNIIDLIDKMSKSIVDVNEVYIFVK
jgi:hypothetical protein